MGFFNKDTAPAASSDAPAPLTLERITDSLDRLDWGYLVDNANGSIATSWEYGWCTFTATGDSGEILSVRGYWRGALEENEYPNVLEACNAWSLKSVWPKTYAVRDDEGLIHVNIEHNVDYEYGLTDLQLEQHLLCAVTSGMAFFAQINETFPEAWERVQSAD